MASLGFSMGSPIPLLLLLPFRLQRLFERAVNILLGSGAASLLLHWQASPTVHVCSDRVLFQLLNRIAELAHEVSPRSITSEIARPLGEDSQWDMMEPMSTLLCCRDLVHSSMRHQTQRPCHSTSW